MATTVLDFEEDHFILVRAINCAGERDNASLYGITVWGNPVYI